MSREPSNGWTLSNNPVTDFIGQLKGIFHDIHTRQERPLHLQHDEYHKLRPFMSSWQFEA